MCPPSAASRSYERSLQLVQPRHGFGAREARRDDGAGDGRAPHALDERHACEERLTERGGERVACAQPVHDVDREAGYVGLLTAVVDGRAALAALEHERRRIDAG